MPQRLRERIQLSGLIRQPEVIDFYACAACLVLPSMSETWGLVVNEALACKLPVLVSRQAGCTADLVKEGVTGWAFDPYNSDQLARLMANIHCMDHRDRVAMGEQGGRLIADWGLARFCQGVLKSARIAASHHHQRHSRRIRLASHRAEETT
jgi:glycosyltransferase involved in cell wall biosynthesis